MEAIDVGAVIWLLSLLGGRRTSGLPTSNAGSGGRPDGDPGMLSQGGYPSQGAIGNPSPIPYPIPRPVPTPTPTAPGPATSPQVAPVVTPAVTPAVPPQSATTPFNPVSPPIRRVVGIGPGTEIVSDVAQGGDSSSGFSFCRGMWMPLLPRPCPPGRFEPDLLPGPPPNGALVVTGPVPGAFRSLSSNSCPDAMVQGGMWVMEAGSEDWRILCGEPMRSVLET
jgi:hypothetical protein